MGASPQRVRLTADEAAAVLRRAVELDAHDGPAGGGELIDVAALEQAAAEVGLSLAAVRQAVAELRTGALAPTVSGSGQSTARRLVGPPVAADQRVVALRPDEALDRAGQALRRQLFELRRSEPGRALWRRRSDVAASIQRLVDLTGRIKLSSVGSITVAAVPLESDEPGHGPAGGGMPSPGPTVSLVRSLVRVEADLASLRPAVAAGAAAPAGVTFGFATLVALVAGEPTLLLAGGAGGVAAGGVGLGVARIWYRRQYREVAELLGWLLDQVGREWQGASGAPSRQPG